jgi:hypothetical protein
MTKRNPMRVKTIPVALFGLLMGLPSAAFAAEAIDHLNVQEPTRPEYLPGKTR